MSYLKFDKTLLTNLEQSLPIEYLRTNKAGAYSCTTVTGCNTRKYHGLLVIPVPELDNDNHVLLSSLDETVIQRGAEFNLGIHKYSGDTFAPRGHKYIREFDCETIVTYIYRVGGVILKKESLIVLNENRVLIRYTLQNAHSETTLRLRPQLAFRNVNDLTQRNNNINYAYEEVPNGVTACLYPGYPTLYMQLSKECKYVSCPDWNVGVEYPREQARGYAYREDLFMPGYLEVSIKKGESIVFSAGITEAASDKLKATFTREMKMRHNRDSFFNCLKISAQNCYQTRGNGEYLLAGYPWFKFRARDTFIALPGSTLSLGDTKEFEKIMATASAALLKYMEDETEDKIITELNAPDIPLWCTWTIQQYKYATSLERATEKYGSLLMSIIDYIVDGKAPNLALHTNGLVYSEGDDQAISWMNATENGHPITPRTGYLVEFNALWYNALQFAIEMLRHSEDKADKAKIEKLQEIAEKYSDNFAKIFTAPGGYLYDYVTEGYSDPNVRPNQIWALSLEYTPLSKAERKIALDMVTKELLTPKGIRSLTPQAGLYRPYYVGNATERNYAYHNGAIWPWLIGAYFEAYLKIFTRSGLSFVTRRLMAYEDEINNHSIGTISELYDGNPPFAPHGAILLAMNVAEILRALKILQDYVPENN